MVFPTTCEACGVSWRECSNRVLKGRWPCCHDCHYGLTHGQPPVAREPSLAERVAALEADVARLRAGTTQRYGGVSS